jgi:phage shock protein A
MNLLEQLALLARSKISGALGDGPGGLESYKATQIERLLKDAEKRIQLLAERQKQTLAKAQKLEENVKASQGAIGQTEQDVDAALQAGDDELARARLARAKAMRLMAEAEDKRLKEQERMAAQLDEEIAVLRAQTQSIREQYSQASAGQPAPVPVLEETPKQTRAGNPSVQGMGTENSVQTGSPASANPEMENGSLADALRKLQGK